MMNNMSKSKMYIDGQYLLYKNIKYKIFTTNEVCDAKDLTINVTPDSEFSL